MKFGQYIGQSLCKFVIILTATKTEMKQCNMQLNVNYSDNKYSCLVLCVYI